jgi:hypothetical protein
MECLFETHSCGAVIFPGVLASDTVATLALSLPLGLTQSGSPKPGIVDFNYFTTRETRRGCSLSRCRRRGSASLVLGFLVGRNAAGAALLPVRGTYLVEVVGRCIR